MCQFDLVSSCDTVHNGDSNNLFLHSTFKNRAKKQETREDNKYREKHSTVEPNTRKSS